MSNLSKEQLNKVQNIAKLIIILGIIILFVLIIILAISDSEILMNLFNFKNIGAYFFLKKTGFFYNLNKFTI